MRLFVAIPLPEALRVELVDWARGGRDILGAARFVEAPYLHLTLRFLGEVEGERTRELLQSLALASAGHRRLDLTLAGPGTLPRRSRARVACLDVEAGAALGRLREAMAGACEETLDLPRDTRPFRPHVTLARTRRPWRASACGAWRARPCPLRGRSFAVTYVSLMESVLSPTGARYSSIGRVDLEA